MLLYDTTDEGRSRLSAKALWDTNFCPSRTPTDAERAGQRLPIDHKESCRSDYYSNIPRQVQTSKCTYMKKRMYTRTKDGTLSTYRSSESALANQLSPSRTCDTVYTMCMRVVTTTNT